MDTDEIRFRGDYYARVPDGEYTAVCENYSKLVPFEGTQKIFLYLKLLKSWQGTRLFMALNVPFSGIRPGSRYFKYWCLANGNRPPSRNAIMSPRIFKGKEFRIFTRTVKPKRGRQELGPDFYYSIVDQIELLQSHSEIENLPDTRNASDVDFP